MSDLRVCKTCGLSFETAWGDDQQYCTYCDEETTYNPSGIPNVEEGARVSHMYFNGVVSSVMGSQVEIEITDGLNSMSSYILMYPDDLNPA